MKYFVSQFYLQTSKILSYISDDGLLWEKEDGLRFESAGFPQVMKTNEGKWRMFYVPSGTYQQNKFLSAISSDGIYFVKEDGERYNAKTNLEKKIQGPRILQRAHPATQGGMRHRGIAPQYGWHRGTPGGRGS